MTRPFCTRCGESIRPDARFCGYCGIELKDDATSVPPRQSPAVGAAGLPSLDPVDPQRLEAWSPQALSDSAVPDDVTSDPDVLAWWSERHDELIRRTMAEQGWYFILKSDDVAAITPPEVLADWRRRHEAKTHVSWYGYLAWFARGRAAKLGLIPAAPSPDVRERERCGQLNRPGFRGDPGDWVSSSLGGRS
jgi:hypothetical protein